MVLDDLDSKPDTISHKDSAQMPTYRQLLTHALGNRRAESAADAMVSGTMIRKLKDTEGVVEFTEEEAKHLVVVLSKNETALSAWILYQVIQMVEKAD